MGVREFDRALRRGRRAVRDAFLEVRTAEARLRKAEARLARHPPKDPLDKLSREELSWRRMIAGCDNPRSKRYGDHGARGIRVAPRWKTFLNFLLDLGPCPPGHVLTRININGDFEPDNCRWATTSQMPFRKRPRNSRFVVLDGEVRSLPKLAKELGMRYDVAYARLIRRGQSVPEAILGARHRAEALCACPAKRLVQSGELWDDGGCR